MEKSELAEIEYLTQISVESFSVFFFFFFQDEDELVLPLRPKKSPLSGLCCLTFGLVVFMAGLVLASIYVYRYYFIPHVRSFLMNLQFLHERLQNQFF